MKLPVDLMYTKDHEWIRIDEHLVHHDASLSGRISDAGSYRKKMGILKFAEKYRSIMTEEIWEEFVHISLTRFKIDLQGIKN